MKYTIAMLCCAVSADALAQEGPLRVRAAPGAQVQMPPPAAPANPELAAELRELRRRDQGIRMRIDPLGVVHGLPLPGPFLDEWHQTDAENMARLREIVATHGWPGPSLVGGEAAIGAFLIVQHADLETQREFLPKLEAAAAAGELPRMQLAYLVDRVRIREGRPQVYGTQLGIDENGKVIAENLEDPDGVDSRRSEVGLPPLAMYLSMAAQSAGKPAEGASPSEPELRKELIALNTEFRAIGPGRLGGGVTRDPATWPAEMRAARDAVRVRAEAAMLRALEGGYPTAVRVGEDGTRAFFSLVSEAGADVQERALAALAAAVGGDVRDDASKARLAWLTDRVRTRRGEPQVYGTQFERAPDGRVVALPIEDEAGVEARRAAAGLRPLAEVLGALNGGGAGDGGPVRVR